MRLRYLTFETEQEHTYSIQSMKFLKFAALDVRCASIKYKKEIIDNVAVGSSSTMSCWKMAGIADSSLSVVFK